MATFTTTSGDIAWGRAPLHNVNSCIKKRCLLAPKNTSLPRTIATDSFERYQSDEETKKGGEGKLLKSVSREPNFELG